MKVFLSHSSLDKEFVRPIVNLLGPDKVIFDEVSFDLGLKNFEEIILGLENSDLFVIFISNNALESQWVKNELTLAVNRIGTNNSKLLQIFPIIIDKSIQYDDERIPEFLKKGFDSYNLRYVSNYKIAYRKIREQLIKQYINCDMNYAEKFNFYYGRNTEIKKACDRIYDPLQSPLKCLVVSGMSGIGKKAFIKKTLREAKLFKEYYEPNIISLGREDTIDDLILKINDLGFGDGIKELLFKCKIVDEKIPILIELLNEAHKFKEHIIIEDAGSLILQDRSIVYWFDKAIKSADCGLTVSVTTNISLDYHRAKKYDYMFFLILSELDISERIGMLSSCLRCNNITLERDEIFWFKDCLSGYPLEIIFCVEELKGRGLQYLKENSYKITQVSFSNCVNILNLVSEQLAYNENSKAKEKMYGLLSFLSEFGTTPLSYLEEIFRIDSEYKEIYLKLVLFSICVKNGSSNEYVKLNSVISQYVLRNKFNIPQEINDLVKSKLIEFNTHIEEDSYLDLCNHSEISYFIKENLKEGIAVPQKLLYSTLYLTSVIELYDNRQYDSAIKIVDTIRENGEFQYFDETAKNHIMFYYCLALSRKQDKRSSPMIDYFAKVKDFNRFHALKGFAYRMIGNIDLSIAEYQQALKIRPKDNMALREIVKDYRLIGEYDTAFEIAKNNYYMAKDNLYHIEGYFDCLIHKEDRTESENSKIEELYQVVKSINDQKETVIFYEIKAAYYLKHKKDYVKCEEIIIQSLNVYPFSTVLHKLKFELYEIEKNIQRMRDAVEDLKRIESKGKRNFEYDIHFREAILDAYEGKTFSAIEISHLNFLPKTMRIMAEQKINHIIKL